MYPNPSRASLTFEYLDLSYCSNIGELSENLGRLLKLRNLNISHSSYVYSDDYRCLNAEVLSTLTKLECLSFSTWSAFVTIKNLPEALNRFTNVKYLNLSGLNRVWHRSREVPIAFGNLKNLVYLDLSNCRVAHCVLDNLGSLTKLQHLNLSLSSCFADCTDLHRSRMSEAIRNLTELRYLDLSSCSGTEEHAKQAFCVFLECIGNLLNLEHLDLSGNASLTSLPDSFRSLRKLHTLDLSRCSRLEVLPSFLNEMDSLKFILLKHCWRLLMSKQDHLNKNLSVLPNFVVHSDSHDSRSNVFLLEDVNRTDLAISRLENVKSVQEARSIKLAGKERMQELELNWTKDVERSVEDMEVLGELVPPKTLEELKIAGYSSVTFPEWVVGITAFHLHNHVRISMSDFPKCNSLPPLGQLSSLRKLVLERMNGISEINWDLCGSRRAFPRLEDFTLRGMESLKVWDTTYPGGTDGVSEFMFPKLSMLLISDCPNLRLKPYPHRVSQWWEIEGSDGVISSWGEGASQISVTSSTSAPVYRLIVSGSKVPMHQWRLLHYLPGLGVLIVRGCSHQRSSLRTKQLWGRLPRLFGHQVMAPYEGFTHLRSLCLFEFESMTTVQQWVGTLASLQELEISSCENLNDLPESMGRLRSLKNLNISYCSSITSLPESIGCLTSLEKLCIMKCHRITCLPESIQQLTKLKRLDIDWCIALERWCITEENKAKLAHIKEKRIYGWSKFFKEADRAC